MTSDACPFCQDPITIDELRTVVNGSWVHSQCAQNEQLMLERLNSSEKLWDGELTA